MVREPQALGGTNSAPNPVDRHSLHPGTGTGPNAITAKAGGEHGQNHRVLDSHDDSRGFRPFSSDDLNAPLSQSENKKKKKSPLAKLTALEPHALAVVLSLFGLAVVVWGLFGNDPLGGEPVAVVSTSPPRANMAKADAGGDGPHHVQYDGPSATGDKENVAVKKMVPPDGTTVTIIDGSSGKNRKVVIPGKAARSH